jgi:hypothetical protein
MPAMPTDNQPTMDLDPTKNDSLNIYIWKNLLKRIETGITVWVYIKSS